VRLLSLPRGDVKIVAAGAVLTVLAYPPFHLLIPSFTCLIPAIYLIQRASADETPLRRGLAQGFWFGVTSGALVLYWMVVALWRFTPLSILGFSATIVALGMYTAILFGLVGWIERKTRISVVASFPLLWTTLEWVVGNGGDVAFPWLGLGTSLTGYPVFIQVADVVGARGITYLLALANAALAVAWLRHGRGRRRWGILSGVGAGIAAALIYGVVRTRSLETRVVGEVALLQPNIGFREKFEASAQDSLVALLVDMSAQASSSDRPDLVVWPEAAVPNYFSTHPLWEQAISSQAAGRQVPILVGGVDLNVYGDGSYDYYNAAFLFDSTGNKDAQPPYHKRYLVPIVERVPFLNPDLFNLRWFGGFGSGGPGPVYEVGLGSFGVMICYESTFEDVARDYRQRGAEFLVNITNDAWFGKMSAPYQHAAHLVMRAIENRVGIARAANSGISGFVDPLGRTYELTELDTSLIVTGELITSDASTIYTKTGDLAGLIAVAGTLALCGYARLKKTI